MMRMAQRSHLAAALEGISAAFAQEQKGSGNRAPALLAPGLGCRQGVGHRIGDDLRHPIGIPHALPRSLLFEHDRPPRIKQAQLVHHLPDKLVDVSRLALHRNAAAQPHPREVEQIEDHAVGPLAALMMLVTTLLARSISWRRCSSDAAKLIAFILLVQGGAGDENVDAAAALAKVPFLEGLQNAGRLETLNRLGAGGSPGGRSADPRGHSRPCAERRRGGEHGAVRSPLQHPDDV